MDNKAGLAIVALFVVVIVLVISQGTKINALQQDNIFLKNEIKGLK